MSTNNHNPFYGDVPETVPLPLTPLTGVLVQIRFPDILSISKADYVADFQEEIREDYPFTHRDDEIILHVGPGGTEQKTSPNWRFFDSERKWRLSLTTNFVTLETRSYLSRADLTDRVLKISEALAKTIKPGIINRIGVRYVDRIHGEHLNNLNQYIRPELIGLANDEYSENILRTMNEAVATTDAGSMIARWGRMQENQTHEPELMPAIAVPSWFLDIDVYQEYERPETFNENFVASQTKSLATRAYGFFRWAVNNEFLKVYGGNFD